MIYAGKNPFSMPATREQRCAAWPASSANQQEIMLWYSPTILLPLSTPVELILGL
jgi:hypothetical protein